ncbi:hypothetical protein O181_091368 [Austropuccinia psidii MF-1]|uniref:Uncharacterized protein n=1 Tax=Austropuccinia psidii MF-1 TaxID=1389203 RepID=A0A9Q3IX90_9BASI|nr:hypothetical protein [Austropuccinia psidii MF-1]
MCSSTTTEACDACQPAHKKCLFVVQPFQPRSQRSSHPRRPCEDSFVVDNDKSIPKWEWTPQPQTGFPEQFRMISPVPSSIDLSTPLLGHHPMVTSLLDLSKVIIRPMKDCNGKRTFELGTIVTMSCHPWDSNANIHLFYVCLASKPCGKPLLAQVAPNGPRTYSANPPNTMSHLLLARVYPPNDLRTLRLMSQNQRWLQHNPWRNHLVSPKFSSPLLCPSPACPTTPCLIIIINDTPVGSPHPISPAPTPPRSTPTPVPSRDLPPIAAKSPTASSLPVPSSSPSYNDARQEFTNLQPTLMIPQAIVHKALNQILLEHYRLLHMIPCMAATH